jgi:uncharacterized protein YneF (UPF0154 family)
VTVFFNMAGRGILMLPLAAVFVVLCVTIIGIPLALPLGAAIGAFVSKPLRQHPYFNIKGDAK